MLPSLVLMVMSVWIPSVNIWLKDFRAEEMEVFLISLKLQIEDVSPCPCYKFKSYNIRSVDAYEGELDLILSYD